MMAPGLPEVAVKYGITDSPTLIALTLSIFLFSFAIGVRVSHYEVSQQGSSYTHFPAIGLRSSVGDVWTDMGM